MKKIILLVCAMAWPAGLLAAQAGQDGAAAFPQRPVRIVIGFTPGGGPDITARFIGQKLAERWHQQVVTDNRPGAGGTIAANIQCRCRPCGLNISGIDCSERRSARRSDVLVYDVLADVVCQTVERCGDDAGTEVARGVSGYQLRGCVCRTCISRNSDVRTTIERTARQV